MINYKDIIIDIYKGDIVEAETKAIVNAANNTLLGGSGVDGAIHKAGGPIILEQCKKLGGCATGDAKITTAGDLPSNYVIHTVGPIYKNNNRASIELSNAYYNSLKLADEYDLKSITFPSISTGVYGYPVQDASSIAFNSIRKYIDDNPNTCIKKIRICLFSEDDYNIYEEVLINSFV